MDGMNTYAFIDATNIIYGCGRAGWRVDFEKLLRYLKTRFSISRVYYYAGVDNKNAKQLKFYEKLVKLGYILRLVPVKTFSDGSKKADVDSRMTFEMMLYLDMYTDVIIFTGDGDYYWVLDYLFKNKSSVKLFGHGKTIARELKQLLGGHVTDIQLIRDILELEQK